MWFDLDEKQSSVEDAIELAQTRLHHEAETRRHGRSPCPAGCEIGPWKPVNGNQGQPRAAQAFNLRYEAARDEYNRSFGFGGTPHKG
jgi:hypothetical protein